VRAIISRAVCLAAAIVLAGVQMAAAAAAPEMPAVEIKVGYSRLIRLPHEVKRVSVGKPEVADVLVINTHQVYINAKSVGTTNITLWGKKDRLLGVFGVRVARDLTLLKRRMHEVLPGEGIEVREMEGTVVLSGRVSSEAVKKQAGELAMALAPREDLAQSLHKQLPLKGYVVNLLEVGAVKQVIIKVRFAEVRRDALQRLKVNLGFRDLAGNFFNTFLGGVTGPLLPTSSNLDLLVPTDDYLNQVTPFSRRPYDLGFSSRMNGALGVNLSDTTQLTGFLEALKERGLAKILAEPNLVAASGQEADFLAGGEFPIPVPQRENITIQFKKFGVQLKFKPTVLNQGRIKLDVEPEVSDLDFSTAVVIQGYTVPGLTTRRAKTSLELANGQSFGMAGMFRDDLAQVVSKVPLLGDIPVLGALFRSTEFQSQKTELVIMATPSILKPGEGAPKSLPTDNVEVPSEFNLFMGEMVKVGPQAKKQKDKSGKAEETKGVPVAARELEGRFGHELPY